MTTNRTAKIEDIRNRNAYSLAGDADVQCPDAPDSAGAQMLMRVRDDVLELIEGVELEDFDRIDDDGSVHLIADGAPSIYTYTKWQQFIDLCAWQEDVTEFGEIEITDMEQGAGIALYMIASRLAFALIEEIREAAQEDANEAELAGDEE